MKEMFTITRKADGLNDYTFESLSEAIEYAKDNEFENDYYMICKILDDNGIEVECLATYDIDGEMI